MSHSSFFSTSFLCKSYKQWLKGNVIVFSQFSFFLFRILLLKMENNKHLRHAMGL